MTPDRRSRRVLHAGPYRLHAVRWRGVRWFALDTRDQRWSADARTPFGAIRQLRKGL